MTNYETPGTFEDLLSLIEAVKGLSKGDKLMYEIGNLYSMRDWALEQQPVQVGDKVVLNTVIDFDKAHGWRGYAEALAFGATGTVMRVEWNGYHKYWAAGFMPDELWSMSDWGPEEKRRYDHPDSKTFTMNIKNLVKI